MQACPCGLKKNYEQCCGLYISGKEAAPTPEALMRSRYSAYALNKMPYVVATMKSPASDRYSDEVASVNNDITWLGLNVLQAKQHDNTGQVEFVARYRLADKEFSIHELSDFIYQEGRWYYVDGVHKEVVGE